ncbi:DUF6929 family protein [Myroides pelagicus]|uniref:Uncharacterized protein n=1 Tax=Myroides pelagicus TaxID=270914 RepID=A0A7K1GLX4_9FLAO|nr:hypothetical protein [Myroides pelagicus]MEC4113153.1 hypothetical protein [Myroides pelagicus]MTH29798.1 hypothetical protein [Myroides pelagicus]
MKQFTLELLFHLFGISAASGLVYNEDQIHVITDDSSYFYHHDLTNNLFTKTPLTTYDYGQELIAKSEKPDYEAITYSDEFYYIFGSGSTDKRINLVEVHRLTNEVSNIKELDILYESMKSFANINNDNFNIEGVIYNDDTWYFFNRGNGDLHQNGIFIVTGESIIDNFKITYFPIKLPKINKVQSSFTDAVKVDNYIYFLAAAEDEQSNYKDGEIKGSLIGRINPQKMKVEKTKVISDTHKFEGITLYKNNESEIQFLLCEDPDNPIGQTGIYQLTIKK